MNFIQAIRIGDIRRVESLINSGADVNAQDTDGATPLHWAVFHGHREIKREIAALLISNGTDVNTKNKDGDTPLHRASFNGYIEMAALLIDKGADVSAQNKDGDTPLYFASFNGDREMAALLISNDADVNAQNKDGVTPLQWASFNGDREMVALLISKGADVNAQNKGRNTPLCFASFDGDREMAALLISKGADVNAKNDDGDAPLHVAFSHGHIEMAELLISKGADVNASNRFGETLLQWASFHYDIEIVALLISNGADINAQGVTFLEEVFNNPEGAGMDEDFSSTERELLAKLLIRHTFYSTEKPEFIGNHLSCSEYWDECTTQLYHKDNIDLLNLFKSENLDEQIQIWSKNKILRDYCTDSEVLKSKYPELVDATINIVNKVKKKIFLHNNNCWKDFIPSNKLPLIQIQEDLDNTIQPKINEIANATGCKRTHEAAEYINSDIVLGVPTLKALALAYYMMDTSSVLEDISVSECLERQHCRL